MDNRIFIEIAEQLRKASVQQEIANYLKLYELTKDPKLLAYASSLMGYKPQKSEVDDMFKSPLR